MSKVPNGNESSDFAVITQSLLIVTDVSGASRKVRSAINFTLRGIVTEASAVS